MSPDVAALLAAASSAIDAGQLAQAEALCRGLLEAQPANGTAKLLLARGRRLGGDFESAAALAEEAARQMPKDPGPRLEAALAYAAGGHFVQAESAARKALRLRPGFLPGLLVCAEVLSLAGKRDAALVETRRAAALAPGIYEVRFAHANALFDAQRFDEAVGEFEAAARLRPELTEADYNRARALMNLERLGEAEDLLTRCIERAPQEADLYNALGMVYAVRNRTDRMFELCDLGIARCEFPWKLWQMKADWSLIEGRPDDCLACHARAREALPPFDAEAGSQLATVRGLTLLTLGQLTGGWLDMRARADRASLADRYPNFAVDPSALPRNLAGKRILIIQEQGLGDELFFLRYAPLLKARGALLSYQGEPKMHAVLHGQSGFVDELLARDATPLGVDVALLSGDLPEAAGGGFEPPLPIVPQAALLETWRARLAALGPPPYVGVTWKAGLGADEAFRSRRPALVKDMPVELLAAAMRDVPGTVLVLQRNPAPGSVARFSAALGRPAHDLSALNERLDEMLALLQLLAEYVCVSNANAHFAASVGLACKVLVMRWPEWRWTAAGETSPWFPGFRLYRQQADGGWAAPLGRLTTDLLAPMR
jgi:tetratricopeptide (TPR) repeat protein